MKYLLVTLLLFGTFHVRAQKVEEMYRPTPYFVDELGKLSDNWLDPDYSPVKPVQVSFDVGESFLPGTIYMNDGRQQKVLLKYNANGRKLVYKPLTEYDVSAKRLTADECSGFTILEDSFTVVRNFRVIKKRSEYSLSERVKELEFDKPEFVEVLGQSNNYCIYKFIDITKNGQNVNNYFLLYNKQDNSIKDVSKANTDWRSDIRPLLDSSEKISAPEDINFRTFFREKSFVGKRNAKEALLFSPYLTELNEEANVMYKAHLERKDKWQLMFQTTSGEPVMDHVYQSILPYEKCGSSTYYYPNGNVRKHTVNVEGRAVAEKRYHANGHLHYDIVQNTIEKKRTLIDWFKLNLSEPANGYWYNGKYYQRDSLQIKHSARYDGKYVYHNDDKIYESYSGKEVEAAIRKNFSKPETEEDLETMYLSVCDTLGNNLLDAKGNGTEKLYDRVQQIDSYRVYTDYQLSEAYYLTNEGEKVYQYCNRPLKINGLKSANALSMLKYQLLTCAWDVFPQGTLLVRFLVDKEGNFKKVEVINAPDNRLKEIMYAFIMHNKSSFSFSIAKHNESKVNGEVVVPFYIGVTGYGPVPTSNHSLWLMQQQQMHMMQMNNTFRPPMRF